MDGRNIDKMIKNEGKMATTVAISERVDAVVHEDVLLIKLDVEGFEPSAFESMKGLFDGHKCGPLNAKGGKLAPLSTNLS